MARGLWQTLPSGDYPGAWHDIEPLEEVRSREFIEDMVRVFGRRYGQLAVAVEGFDLSHCAILTGSPAEAVHLQPVPPPDDDVTEEQPKNITEARRMIRQLRKERDDARKMSQAYREKHEAAAHRAKQGERYLAVLTEVISLFVEDGGYGFVRSVNVSLDDYHAWCMLVRAAQKAGSGDDAA
jgi:hypothetical protein